jgi:hypothetical protein
VGTVEKSRRTLAMPQSAVATLREHRKWQAQAQLAAGPLWQDTGLVFTTSTGTPLDASHVRPDFRALSKKAGIEGVWAPRELRHTFVSVMSVSGVAVEEIAPPGRARQLPYHRDHLPARAPSGHHHWRRRHGQDKGGHFAALEQPEILVSEIRTGLRTLRS